MSRTTPGTGAAPGPISILRSPGPARSRKDCRWYASPITASAAIVDAAGRVVARIDLDSVGYADVAAARASSAPTLYARGGRLDFACAAVPRPSCRSHFGCADGFQELHNLVPR